MMRLFKSIPIFLIIYVFSTAQVLSNQVQYDYLTEPSVAAGISINTILKDSQGFIWFGTEQGLIRYDGYDYIQYNHIRGDSNSLSSSKITSVIEDENNIIWIGTFQGGLNRFDPKTEKFTNYLSNNAESNTFSGLDINTMTIDDEGVLWIGYRNEGLDRFNPNTGDIYNFSHHPDNPVSIISNGVSSLFFDSEKNLWIGTWDNGLCLLERSEMRKNNFDKYQFKNKSGFYKNKKINKIFSITQDQIGNLWMISFGEGLFTYHPKTNKYKHIIVPGGITTDQNIANRSILVSKGGGLFAGRENLFIINSLCLEAISESFETGTQFVSKNEYFTFYPLQSKLIYPVINSMLEEDNATLWVGTDAGCFKFTRKRFNTFKILSHQDESNNFTASAVTPEGMLYLSAWEDGIYSGNIRITGIQNAVFNKIDIPGDYEKDVTTLIYEKGNLWFTSMESGIFRYNNKIKELNWYKDIIKPIGIGDINYSIISVKGPDNSIWFGTAAGLIRYYSDQDQFYYDSQDSEDPNSLSNEFITCMVFENDTTIWIGTLQEGLNRGTFKKDQPEEIQFEHFTYNYKDPASISENRVSDLCLTSENELWIGTSNNGLNYYNRQNNDFIRYGKEEGMASNKISFIMEDRSGDLWIGTPAGLSRFNSKEYYFVNYALSVDKRINYFNPNACFVLNDQIILSTRENLIVFNPDEITSYIPPSDVMLTNLKIDNQTIHPGDQFNDKIILDQKLEYTDHLVLSYTNNSFSIQFSLLDYVAPENNRYFYRLDPFDKDWKNTSAAQREASYTNIPPGNYVFRIKASNSDGVFTTNETTLNVAISPPWYQTIYAVIIYILFLIFLAFSIRKITITRLNYMNKIKTQKILHEKDNEVYNAKLRFFTNISHEIRTPVTLIISPLESLMQKAGDESLKKQIGTVLRNARKLKGLLSQLMEFRKIETGNIKLKVFQYDVVEYLKEMMDDFRILCEHKQISLEFKSNPQSIEAWFDMEKMDKVMQNLLSNALKFTNEGGRIEVKTYISSKTESPENEDNRKTGDQSLIIKVTDNGVGIPGHQINLIFDRFYQVDTEHEKYNPSGTGIGLSIVKEYIQLHHGTIHAESIPGIETTFTISIPLGKEHFGENEILQEALATSHREEFLVDDNIPQENISFTFNSVVDEKHSILIVEDNRELRNFLKESLNNTFVIHEAGNGKEAWERILKNLPDLVISDVMMPEMDGLELTEKIKTNIRTSHLPVILLTAKSAIEDRIVGLKAGADSYIPKPFHPEHLQVRIQKLISLRNTLKKKFSQDIDIKVEELEIGSLDAGFLKKLNSIIEENIGDFNLDVDKLCKHVGMSRSNLFKKLKALTDLSPTEYMRNIRVKKALQLMLKDKSLNISDVGYSVGYNSPAYFTHCFKKVFGLAPREFIDDYAKKNKDLK